MGKVLKDTKTLLLENMAKLNPDFQLNEENKKWIQNAITPKHNTTNTSEGLNMYSSEDEIKEYTNKVQKLKILMDTLISTEEFDIIDTLYRLLIEKRNVNKNISLAENISLEFTQKN